MMKRRLLKIFLLIFAGAIVNVAVAWVISVFIGAIRIRENNWRELSVEFASEYWLSHAPVEWHNAVHRWGNSVESWAIGRADVMVLADDPSSIPTEPGKSKLPERSWSIGHVSSGWPLLAMRADYRVVREGRFAKGDCTYCWRADVKWVRNKTVPLLPIFPGFAINTMFYAAILWMLSAAPSKLRRWRRIRSALCPACAYPVGQSPTCTECGKAVKVLPR